MKCIYRGHAYEVSAPVQPSANASNQSNVKLIYRGHTYNYIPPVVTPKTVEAQG